MEEQKSCTNLNEGEEGTENLEVIQNPTEDIENIVDTENKTDMEEQNQVDKSVESVCDESVLDETVNSASDIGPDNNQNEIGEATDGICRDEDEVETAVTMETNDSLMEDCSATECSSPKEQPLCEITDTAKDLGNEISTEDIASESNLTEKNSILNTIEDEIIEENSKENDIQDCSDKVASPKDIETNLDEVGSETTEESALITVDKELIEEEKSSDSVLINDKSAEPPAAAQSTEEPESTDEPSERQESESDVIAVESESAIDAPESENDPTVSETLESEIDHQGAIETLESENDQGELSVETENTKSTEDNQEVEPILSSPPDKSADVDESIGDTSENVSANIENFVESEQSENTEFVHVNSEKDYNEKDNKGDELLEDPIGGGDEENDTDNVDALGEGADEELCIIPDTERILSQEEKDSACTLSTLKDLSAASADKNESTQNTECQEASITVIKYKEKNPQACYNCVLVRIPKYEFRKESNEYYLCNDNCLEKFKNTEKANVLLNWESEIRVKDLTPKTKDVKFRRICASCKEEIYNEETNLCWEIMDFCNETCLTKYQKEIGSKCSSCSGDVKPNSLGKYCVRFGNDIRQFCTSHCLETHKKGLKVCSYCQQDSPTGSEGFLAVGEKGQFKDFCSQACMEKYDVMTNNRPPKVPESTKCCVCKLSKPITMSFQHNGVDNYFCSEPCFVAFSFVNSIKSDKCAMCRRNFCSETLAQHTMFYENSEQSFCSNSCQNIYIIAHRKIVPCTWCKVRKYNFDMIRRFNRSGPLVNMCSVNCLNLYQVSLNAVTSKNFPVPTGTPKRSKRLSKSNDVGSKKIEPSLPVISSVQSLANSNGAVNQVSRTTRSKTTSAPVPQPEPVPVQSSIEIPVQVKHHIIVKNAPIPNQRNVATMCRTRMSNKGVNATPKVEDAQVQTDKREADKILIPVPIPIFIPLPMHMFSAPVPMPVPIPIPVPVPVFIPTTRNSANGIMKEIKKIQVKIPTNPYEAELLMMAEMVADDKKEENTDSESDVEDTGADDTGGGGFSPEPQDGSNTFGDDMLQMALKMATELDEPAVDLEGALTANTITASQTQDEVHNEPTEDVSPDQMNIMERSQRGRKRGMRGNGRGQGGGVSKRGRRSLSQHVELPMMQQPAPPAEPQEKPDANMCLKYTFGVNAWKQWVTFKNAELEKSSRRVKLFKTEILQLTADELNYSLCLFVKEVRKPNGAEYAPDTIYYLCLGIQQYLFENGRIDNIFCDAYYEKFTDCLDEVAKRFSVLYNDSHYIVTRVEEEHLWESKQLGAHSPHVLLSTLMFFNTKHFNLTTVDEHMQLSFSHIMKHWKRNPNQAGASKIPGSRNVLLRFYPPQSAIQNNARKKKVYEQQENEENPLRCPVKLYEFYLSKCPESVKTRNDVFYLQPERSCVPDSPVWYSTMPLPRDALEKMLHRVKMVKEINVALLTS